MNKSLQFMGILKIASIGLLIGSSGYLNAKDFTLWGKKSRLGTCSKCKHERQ
jgi:hypothetical protein